MRLAMKMIRHCGAEILNIFIKRAVMAYLMLAYFLILLCVVIAVVLYISPTDYKPFYINNSDSAPHGIYAAGLGGQEKDGGIRIELLVVGRYYLVELPVDVPVLDKKAGFNLIKLCSALPGTDYTVTGKELAANGRIYPISAKEGLPHLKHGSYVVPADAALFLNEPETSFDSRYLGPVNRQYVKRVLYYIGPEDKFIFIAEVYATLFVICLLLYLKQSGKGQNV